MISIGRNHSGPKQDLARFGTNQLKQGTRFCVVETTLCESTRAFFKQLHRMSVSSRHQILFHLASCFLDDDASGVPVPVNQKGAVQITALLTFASRKHIHTAWICWLLGPLSSVCSDRNAENFKVSVNKWKRNLVEMSSDNLRTHHRRNVNYNEHVHMLSLSCQANTAWLTKKINPLFVHISNVLRLTVRHSIWRGNGQDDYCIEGCKMYSAQSQNNGNIGGHSTSWSWPQNMSYCQVTLSTIELLLLT